MHIQVGAHAMPRSVQVVQSLAPQGLTGEDVKLRTAGARGELAEFYLDMAFQHEGVDALLLFRQGAEGNGAGDVGGAVEILCAAVEQQEAFWLQRYIRLRSGLVMYDGTMSLIAGDGVEG